MSKITVYITSVSSSAEIKKDQQRIRNVLGDNYKGCEIQYVDIASDSKYKDKMREIVGDAKALPPKIAKGDEYLGDCNAFENAVEAEDLKTFLKMD